jgi:phosphate transport system substrate-binding protein
VTKVRKGNAVLNANTVASVCRIMFVFVCSSALGWASTVCAADEIRIGGTGGALGAMRLLANAYAHEDPGAKVSVLPSLGSGGGIKALLAGAIEIAVSSRALQDKERSQGALELEYARTPFVFATAATTKATGITITEVAGIYSGKIQNWPDGTRVWLVMRPRGDSDTDLINRISADVRAAMAEAQERPGLLFAVTDQECAAALEKHIGSFGPSTLAQILSEKRKLKALRINDVEPTTSALAGGRYPYYKPLFIVTTSKPVEAARRFIAFVQSKAGRNILTRTGHVVPPFQRATHAPR